jgi:hypothetical protein
VPEASYASYSGFHFQGKSSPVEKCVHTRTFPPHKLRTCPRCHSSRLHKHKSLLYKDFQGLIAEFYLVDRGLRHRLPGFSSLGRLVILP